MQVSIDRPADHLLTDRVELLSGWIGPAREEFALSATCGGRELPLRPCWHPVRRLRSDVQGFWGFLVLQELLDCVRYGCLRVDLFWQGTNVASLHLRVTPVASSLASDYPIDLDDYPVPAAPARAAAHRPHTLVFPGLGGVGGASMNQLLRMKMFRLGWGVPVHFEANAPGLWRSARAEATPAPRWIDGHDCFHAADGLGLPFARVTLLREPVRRLVSIFNYNSLVHPHEFRFPTFMEFVESGAARRFTQAASLLRCAGISPERDLQDSELYRAAKVQLTEHYALVGITELYEESIFLLCQLAGYDSIGMWWKVLSAPRTFEPEGLPIHVRRRLDEIVAIDRRLYEEAKRDLVNRLAEADLDEPLRRYKAGAAAQHELPDVYKLFECLRWRQILSDAELVTLKGARAG